jgi:hypothetical protein
MREEEDFAVGVTERLDKMEALLATLVERQVIQECYSTVELSRVVGRAEFTVREWCRHGRINAKKKSSGRGAHAAWVISHDELLRFRREGLLPLGRPGGGRR